MAKTSLRAIEDLEHDTAQQHLVVSGASHHSGIPSPATQELYKPPTVGSVIRQQLQYDQQHRRISRSDNRSDNRSGNRSGNAAWCSESNPAVWSPIDEDDYSD